MLNLENLTAEQLAKCFDHTLLKADAVEADFVKLCDEAKEYGFYSVMVNPSRVALCKKLLEGTDIKVGLIPDAVFMGGAEEAMGSGIVYNPNMPSEEVFSTPKKGIADGIVCNTARRICSVFPPC